MPDFDPFEGRAMIHEAGKSRSWARFRFLQVAKVYEVAILRKASGLRGRVFAIQ